MASKSTAGAAEALGFVGTVIGLVSVVGMWVFGIGMAGVVIMALLGAPDALRDWWHYKESASSAGADAFAILFGLGLLLSFGGMWVSGWLFDAGEKMKKEASGLPLSADPPSAH